jgi:hypothetical protein
MTENVDIEAYQNPTYTLDLNGKRYALTNSFRQSIERRAKREYKDNEFVECWWKDDDGNPILVIETAGTTVPWEKLDQLDVEMQPPAVIMQPPSDGDDPDEIDEGGGVKTIEPDEHPETDDEFNIGRTHFGITPHNYEEVPAPMSDDPDTLPPKPKKLTGTELVKWIPKNPDVDHTWATGETITPVDVWVEWDVQKRAEQPRKDNPDSHDAFESLCNLHDCPVIGEYTLTDTVPKDSGSVERKGQKSFEEGKYGGSNWSV